MFVSLACVVSVLVPPCSWTHCSFRNLQTGLFLPRLLARPHKSWLSSSIAFYSSFTMVFTVNLSGVYIYIYIYTHIYIHIPITYVTHTHTYTLIFPPSWLFWISHNHLLFLQNCHHGAARITYLKKKNQNLSLPWLFTKSRIKSKFNNITWIPCIACCCLYLQLILWPSSPTNLLSSWTKVLSVP